MYVIVVSLAAQSVFQPAWARRRFLAVTPSPNPRDCDAQPLSRGCQWTMNCGHMIIEGMPRLASLVVLCMVISAKHVLSLVYL